MSTKSVQPAIQTFQVVVESSAHTLQHEHTSAFAVNPQLCFWSSRIDHHSHISVVYVSYDVRNNIFSTIITN